MRGRNQGMALTAADVLIEAIQDWGEPPLPAKVTLDQAAKFAKSLLRGEPNSQKNRAHRAG